MHENTERITKAVLAAVFSGEKGEEESLEELRELAKTAGSFNYEYVCDITKRVPRVYIENGKVIG